MFSCIVPMLPHYIYHNCFIWCLLFHLPCPMLEWSYRNVKWLAGHTILVLPNGYWLGGLLCCHNCNFSSTGICLLTQVQINADDLSHPHHRCYLASLLQSALLHCWNVVCSKKGILCIRSWGYFRSFSSYLWHERSTQQTYKGKMTQGDLLPTSYFSGVFTATKRFITVSAILPLQHPPPPTPRAYLVKSVVIALLSPRYRTSLDINSGW